MNRRELLREMSRVQATWVNRNTPGTGDVNIAVEDEQDYLTQIAAVFERAREEVRRKRGRAVTAGKAAAAISMLLAGFDKDQPRDRKGRWSDREGGAPSAPATVPAAKPAEAATPAPGIPWADRHSAAKSGAAALAAAPVGLERKGPTTLTPAERFGLSDYQEEDYRHINGFLRDPSAESGGGESQIAGIDAAMDKSVLTSDVAVTRGVIDAATIWGAAAGGNLTGAEWTELAYLSATVDPKVAARFLAEDDESVVMRIVVPAGTKGIEMSGASYESELLLQRGLRLRVAADSGPGTAPRRIDVEVVA